MLTYPFQTVIILDSHLSFVEAMVKMAKHSGKNVFLHADLIQGLKSDLAAAEFICQNLRPKGVISTRGNVLEIAKKRGLKTVQRIFMLDSRSLDTGCRLFEQIHPDVVELLPGIIPSMIEKLKTQLGVPVIAGGLIHTEDEVRQALAAGASAISTSDRKLWQLCIHDSPVM